ncbi:hypothetical protein [Sediminicoccus sp. BL-A-41-H5]|uniref:hypothetical protein n=1 Tax=Sediminicoccus sp. BL-A-41-H5 TaxID=3421106 RepID=UPI003D668993
MRRAILTVMILAGLAGRRAEAQGAACNGRVAIESVYQTGVGGERFEYFFVLRHTTTQRVTADVTFSGFPSNVTLFPPMLPNIPMSPNATVSPNTRFGDGTNNIISGHMVRIVHDSPPPAGPAVRVTNCRAGWRACGCEAKSRAETLQRFEAKRADARAERLRGQDIPTDICSAPGGCEAKSRAETLQRFEAKRADARAGRLRTQDILTDICSAPGGCEAKSRAETLQRFEAKRADARARRLRGLKKRRR